MSRTLAKHTPALMSQANLQDGYKQETVVENDRLLKQMFEYRKETLPKL